MFSIDRPPVILLVKYYSLALYNCTFALFCYVCLIGPPLDVPPAVEWPVLSMDIYAFERSFCRHCTSYLPGDSTTNYRDSFTCVEAEVMK